MIVVTNNPKVKIDSQISCDKIYMDSTYKEVLTAVRDKIHQGHKLLSHPLSGSVKPGESPYKSILISEDSIGLDMDSLRIIENSIIISENFVRDFTKHGYNNQEDLLADFSEIDHSLISSAFESVMDK